MRSPEEIEALLDRVEGLLSSVDDANDRFDRGQWKERHAAEFGPLEENLKKLNGDDFDIYNESYDEYNRDYKDIGEDVYASKLVENIKNIFDRVWPEATEEEKAEAAEAVVEETETTPEAEAETTPEGEGEVTKVETTDPEVAEEVTDAVKDDIPSDEDIKQKLERHPGRDGKPFWGNPSESGGRDGKCGISDEDAKEAPKESDAEDDHEKELEEFRKSVEKERDRYTRK